MRNELFLLVSLACIVSSARGKTIVLQGATQGTTYHIKIASPPEKLDTKRLQADVDATLAEIDREMSTYRSDSEISEFNRAPAGEWFQVARPVRDLVALSCEISEKTNGAQDVTVGPLVRLWHMGPPDGTTGAEAFRPPTDEQIREARKNVGYEKLEFRVDREVLRKRVDGLEVDLSSVAQGYTVDRVALVLRKHKIANFMVEIGGELFAAGKREDGSEWKVAIERPLAGKHELELAVSLSDAALATAGGNRHFFEYEGKRYSHIIDPATGRPVEHTLASVTVAADSCTDADAWDTPLVVLGPDRGARCAEKNGIAAMFISHTDAGDVVQTTSEWKKRFRGAQTASPRK